MRKAPLYCIIDKETTWFPREFSLNTTMWSLNCWERKKDLFGHFSISCHWHYIDFDLPKHVFFKPFPKHALGFLWVFRTSLSKTQSVFYLFREFSATFYNDVNRRLQTRWVWKCLKFVVWVNTCRSFTLHRRFTFKISHYQLVLSCRCCFRGKPRYRLIGLHNANYVYVLPFSSVNNASTILANALLCNCWLVVFRC